MASKPTITDAEWASNANISGGPQSGQTTKSDPGLSVRQAGAVPGRGIVGRTLNFLLYQLYLWCVYLNDLHNSSAFLSQNYPWTGAHTWDQTIKVDGEYAYESARTYTKYVPLTDGYRYNNVALTTGVTHELTSVAAASSDVVTWEPNLPSNATVKEVRVTVRRAAGGSGNITMTVYKIEADVSAAPTAPVATSLGSDSTSGTSEHNELLVVNGLSWALSPTAATSLKVQVAFSNSGDADSIYSLAVEYTVSSNRPG